MSYLKYSIERPLYGMLKAIKSPSLKIGDRFILEGASTLYFKIDIAPSNGKYLCCNENGQTIWLDGGLKVTRINGISFTFNSISKYFLTTYLKKEKK